MTRSHDSGLCVPKTTDRALWGSVELSWCERVERIVVMELLYAMSVDGLLLVSLYFTAFLQLRKGNMEGMMKKYDLFGLCRNGHTLARLDQLQVVLDLSTSASLERNKPP